MITIPVGQGVRLVVHKRVAPIFKAFCDEIDARGYDLDAVADDWGYANRPIRGSSSPSNHSWGLAIDLNATKNPMSATLKTDIPSWVIELAEQKYGLSWGGRYRTRPDAMHFEFLGTPADADRIVARLAAIDPPPPPAPPDDEEIIDMLAKSVDDARRGEVRRLYLELTGDQPTVKQLADGVNALERMGYEALVTSIADGPAGQAFRAAQRKLLGLK